METLKQKGRSLVSIVGGDDDLSIRHAPSREALFMRYRQHCRSRKPLAERTPEDTTAYAKADKDEAIRALELLELGL